MSSEMNGSQLLTFNENGRSGLIVTGTLADRYSSSLGKCGAYSLVAISEPELS